MADTISIYIDRDSFWPFFYQTLNPVYGKAPVTIPMDLYNRWTKAMDDFEETQAQIKKYWDEAQTVES